MKTKFIEVRAKRESFDETGIARLVNIVGIEQVIPIGDNSTIQLLSGEKFDVIETYDVIKNLMYSKPKKAESSKWDDPS